MTQSPPPDSETTNPIIHTSLPTRFLRFTAVCAGGAIISACSALDYHRHALSGQFEIWRKQVPVTQFLEENELSVETRDKLTYAIQARDFAFSRLALPDNGSYRDYVRLNRDFVVWNVFATPQLSLDPIQFCYPLFGCFSYRGFFSEDRADRYAKKLRQEGHDVFIGGVAAYSTLGWFDDPLLSSIIERDKTSIAEIIFHELAHEQIYVKDDTSFNESFAMAVASAGLRLWIPLQGGDLSEFKLQQNREKQFIGLLLHSKGQLKENYESDLTDSEKLSGKKNIILSLKEEYKLLKDSWQGDPSYDRWIQTGLNNAKMASVSTYHDHVIAFTSIFDANGQDFSEFYIRVGRLAKLAPQERKVCLQALAKASASATTRCRKITAVPK